MEFINKNKYAVLLILMLTFTLCVATDAFAGEKVAYESNGTPYAGVTLVLYDDICNESLIDTATLKENNSTAVGTNYDETNDISEEEIVVNDVDYIRYVTTLLNVRTKPNDTSDVLGKLSIKTEVQVTGEVQDSNWVRINYNGIEAYICSDYLVDSIDGIEAFTYNYNWAGEKLNRNNGKVYGPSGYETYYNLDMSGVIRIMNNHGYYYDYWVRSDGVKMYGNYIMVACDLSVHPRGSLVETTLGTGIVCDTGSFTTNGSGVSVDVATSWGN